MLLLRVSKGDYSNDMALLPSRCDWALVGAAGYGFVVDQPDGDVFINHGPGIVDSKIGSNFLMQSLNLGNTDYA